MRTAEFDFELPPELIAQHPAPKRDASRLLVLHRDGNRVEHKRFPDLAEILQPGDVLVLNDSRAIPARLRGVNSKSGGKFEVLLLEENGQNDWWVMLRPGRRARVGTKINFCNPDGNVTNVRAEVVATNDEGHRRLRFLGTVDIGRELERLGEVPLPPYIERPIPEQEDKERYQTVFARADGSVAAPTAGLHFTPEWLERIRARGVNICFITLHVGAGTFLPVKTESLAAHKMHEEKFEIGEAAADAVNDAKSAGRRIVAVGTTTVRALESVAARNAGKMQKIIEKTGIFIYPPFRFQIVDAMLTNFHLPRSTLLMLVSAFAAPGKTQGCEMILRAYAEAVRERYRFFSYGDAMLII